MERPERAAGVQDGDLLWIRDIVRVSFGVVVSAEHPVPELVVETTVIASTQHRPAGHEWGEPEIEPLAVFESQGCFGKPPTNRLRNPLNLHLHVGDLG